MKITSWDYNRAMQMQCLRNISNISDGQMLPFLLDQVNGPICQVSADGGYDRRTCYEAIARRGAKAAIPPRHGAKIWQIGNCRAERLARDENLRRIR